MLSSGIYRLGPVTIGAAQPGGVLNQALVTGSDIRSEPTTGEAGTRHHSVYGQRPVARFSTYDLAVALAACGSQGCSMEDSNLVMYARLIDNKTGLTATSGHKKWTIASGLLFPASLQVDHQGDCRLDYQSVITAIDENDPIVPAAASLPAGVADNRWTLKEASIAGIGDTGLKNVAINFGFRITEEGDNSEIYASQAVIEEITPEIVLRGVDPDWFDAVDLQGEAAVAASVTFQKRANRSTFAANTLTLTFTGIAYMPDLVTAQQRGPSQCSVAVRAEWDGTNDPLVLTTT